MRAHVFKTARSWCACYRGEQIFCGSWHDAMQAAWGMVMFP